MQAADQAGQLAAGFSTYQKWVVGLLTFLQFTIILDFMILSPLGAMLMPQLSITPAQFGLVVSVYAFSAGASGLLAAGFVDRFDRKRVLLVFYGGFAAGTLMCGLARTYGFLLFARMITGVFAGVLGSTVFAITTDLFPYQIRGVLMGLCCASTSASSAPGPVTEAQPASAGRPSHPKSRAHPSKSNGNGVVTLHGMVASASDLQDALRITSRVNGVKDVVDELEIWQFGGRSM